MPYSTPANYAPDSMMASAVNILGDLLSENVGNTITLHFNTVKGEARIYTGEIESVIDSASGGCVTLQVGDTFKRAILANVTDVRAADGSAWQPR